MTKYLSSLDANGLPAASSATTLQNSSTQEPLSKTNSQTSAEQSLAGVHPHIAHLAIPGLSQNAGTPGQTPPLSHRSGGSEKYLAPILNGPVSGEQIDAAVSAVLLHRAVEGANSQRTPRGSPQAYAAGTGTATFRWIPNFETDYEFGPSAVDDGTGRIRVYEKQEDDASRSPAGATSDSLLNNEVPLNCYELPYETARKAFIAQGDEFVVTEALPGMKPHPRQDLNTHPHIFFRSHLDPRSMPENNDIDVADLAQGGVQTVYNLPEVNKKRNKGVMLCRHRESGETVIVKMRNKKKSFRDQQELSEWSGVMRLMLDMSSVDAGYAKRHPEICFPGGDRHATAQNSYFYDNFGVLDPAFDGVLGGGGVGVSGGRYGAAAEISGCRDANIGAVGTALGGLSARRNSGSESELEGLGGSSEGESQGGNSRVGSKKGTLIQLQQPVQQGSKTPSLMSSASGVSANAGKVALPAFFNDGHSTPPGSISNSKKNLKTPSVGHPHFTGGWNAGVQPSPRSQAAMLGLSIRRNRIPLTPGTEMYYRVLQPWRFKNAGPGFGQGVVAGVGAAQMGNGSPHRGPVPNVASPSHMLLRQNSAGSSSRGDVTPVAGDLTPTLRALAPTTAHNREQIGANPYAAHPFPNTLNMHLLTQPDPILDMLPHVCKVLDLLEDQTHFYVVLEYVRGRDLFDFFVADRIYEKGEKYKSVLTRQLARDVVLSLREFHGCGLLHKDVKLENIVVDEGEREQGNSPVLYSRLKMVDYDTCEVFCPNSIGELLMGNQGLGAQMGLQLPGAGAGSAGSGLLPDVQASVGPDLTGAASGMGTVLRACGLNTQSSGRSFHVLGTDRPVHRAGVVRGLFPQGERHVGCRCDFLHHAHRQFSLPLFRLRRQTGRELRRQPENGPDPAASPARPHRLERRCLRACRWGPGAGDRESSRDEPARGRVCTPAARLRRFLPPQQDRRRHQRRKRHRKQEGEEEEARQGSHCEPA